MADYNTNQDTYRTIIPKPEEHIIPEGMIDEAVKEGYKRRELCLKINMEGLCEKLS